MLWKTISPMVEVSACGRLSVRWRPAGFGLWVAGAYVGEKLLKEFVNGEEGDAREKARAHCQDWGHLVA